MLSVEINADWDDLDNIKYYLKKWQPNYVALTNLKRIPLKSSLKLAQLIQDKLKIPVIIHLVGINQSKEDILKQIRQLKKYHINNVLALRGEGKQNKILPFNYANQLIDFMKDSTDGFNYWGACYPEKHPDAPDLVTDISHLQFKIKSGAYQLISQMFFDNSLFYQFYDLLKAKNDNVNIFAGIMPLVKKTQIQWMQSNGTTLPKEIMNNPNDYISSSGINYTIEQINDLISHNISIHLFTNNQWKIMDEIFQKSVLS